jgi:hypothetical protein
MYISLIIDKPWQEALLELCHLLRENTPLNPTTPLVPHQLEREEEIEMQLLSVISPCTGFSTGTCLLSTTKVSLSLSLSEYVLPIESF